MTYAEAEKLLIHQLSPVYDDGEAASLAWYAMEHSCRISRATFLLRRNEPLSLLDETSLMQLADELVTGKPIQYITGETSFYGLTFKVNASVLIPRPETEELVKWVVELSAISYQTLAPSFSVGAPSARILDIGTGSGCIAVAVKKQLPWAEVWGMDVSFEALEVALKNAVLNQAEVRFIQGDVLARPLPEAISGEKFEVIVSNPPYITIAEKESMHRNVVDFEPHIALFVANHDPLLFYRSIANLALTQLKPGGSLFFEINEHYGPEVVTLLKEKGFDEVELRKDMMGRERMVRALSNYE